MTVHLYLSLMPEALIASQLDPEAFGVYYTVGYTKRRAGQAMFIELDPDFRHEFFRIEEGIARCVPHDDGLPKKSVYISTYRVLEHVPLNHVEQLHLVTRYGKSLALSRNREIPAVKNGAFMYQEIAPVSPLVVSRLNPLEYYRFLVKDPESMIHLPAVSFVELELGELAQNPDTGSTGNLPYDNIYHLRECLIELQTKEVHTKMVDRTHDVEFPYRMIGSGIYVSNEGDLAYFPLPSRDELRSTYFEWWKSANQ